MAPLKANEIRSNLEEEGVKEGVAVEAEDIIATRIRRGRGNLKDTREILSKPRASVLDMRYTFATTRRIWLGIG